MAKAHNTEFSLQEMFNNSYDKTIKKVVFFQGALAIDGPNQGEVVLIGAKYNATIGDYELLTAGSGTTASDTTNTVLLQDGGNFLLQTGDELLLQA